MLLFLCHALSLCPFVSSRIIAAFLVELDFPILYLVVVDVTHHQVVPEHLRYFVDLLANNACKDLYGIHHAILSDTVDNFCRYCRTKRFCRINVFPYHSCTAMLLLILPWRKRFFYAFLLLQCC